MLRVLWIGWLFNVKNLTNSLFFVLISVLQPVIFASIAFFMFDTGDRAGGLLYAALGAGLMGIWSSTLFGSGGAIQWMRWQGTLEIAVAAPVRFLWVLLPLTISTATIGLYSIVATLFWGRVFFGVPFSVDDWPAFVVAIPTAVIGLGLLGLVLASTFVLYRQASAFSNLLEYPVWLATGLLVPLSLLPGWVEWLSWLLAPTWGMEAVRNAALGGEVWEGIGMCILLGAVYLVLGSFFMQNFERRARQQATLSLT